MKRVHSERKGRPCSCGSETKIFRRCGHLDHRGLRIYYSQRGKQYFSNSVVEPRRNRSLKGNILPTKMGKKNKSDKKCVPAFERKILTIFLADFKPKTIRSPISFVTAG